MNVNPQCSAHGHPHALKNQEKWPSPKALGCRRTIGQTPLPLGPVPDAVAGQSPHPNDRRAVDVHDVNTLGCGRDVERDCAIGDIRVRDRDQS
jgi:hypothetical protein